MCDCVGNLGVRCFTFMVDKNYEFQGATLIWNKIPNYYYISTFVSALLITLGLLYLPGVIPCSNPILNIVGLTSVGGAIFITYTVLAVRRYLCFRQAEKLLDNFVSELLQSVMNKGLNSKATPFAAVSHINAQIFSYLSVAEAVNVSKICKSTYETISSLAMSQYWDEKGQACFTDWGQMKVDYAFMSSKELFNFKSLLDRRITQLHAQVNNLLTRS